MQECLAGLHETRQHDEEIAGNERGDERVARLAEDIPHAYRCERGDQSREHPQTDQQRDRDVRHEVDLQTAQLLQPQRACRVGRNREQSVRREASDEASGRRDRIAGDVQHVEQALPARDADDGDTQDEGEEHDRGNDVVRQRVERVRGNVQIDEVEGGPRLDQARAEERGVLDRGKRQRDQERERQRQDPQAADHGGGFQTQRLQLGRPERPQAGDDRDRDVGQDHHLEQLDEAVRRPLQRRRLLAEEQPGEDAEREPDEDLARERHETVDRKARNDRQGGAGSGKNRAQTP